MMDTGPMKEGQKKKGQKTNVGRTKEKGRRTQEK